MFVESYGARVPIEVSRSSAAPACASSEPALIYLRSSRSFSISGSNFLSCDVWKAVAIMATDTHKHTAGIEPEPHHSAFAEFNRDERRPAVLLLTILVVAALFFALGIMVGR